MKNTPDNAPPQDAPSRHAKSVHAAATDFQTQIGRVPTPAEIATLEEALREKTVRDIVSRAAGRPEWVGDTPSDRDGTEFGLDLSAAPPSIWGSGEQVYWSIDELAIMYGGDGTGKTTIAHNVVAAMFGFDGQQTVLGQPVRLLKEGERVLYLAFDRHRQTERSWSRFMAPEHADLVRDRLTWRIESFPFDPVIHPLWVADWINEVYPGTYAVVFDNVWDAFGDFSNTEAATAAGIALNNTTRSGVNVLALHHDRKGDGAGKKPPETDEGMYGGRNFKAKAGSVINLWKPPGSDGTTLVVTQHKEPSEKIPAQTVLMNQKAGTLLSLTSGLVTLPDFLVSRGQERSDIKTLAKIFRKTETPDKADREATRRELDRLVSDGLVTEEKSDTPRGATTWIWTK